MSTTQEWRQHPTKQQLYSLLPPITKTIQVRRTRHTGHCWRSRDELIRDILQWTPSHERAKAGRPDRTYIQQLCVDTGCSLENLLGTIYDREGSGRCALSARRDDDDDDDDKTYSKLWRYKRKFLKKERKRPGIWNRNQDTYFKLRWGKNKI